MYSDTVSTRQVFIDEVTYSNSAFGATTDTGEPVFINSRIVSAVKIKQGDMVEAALIPNYEDKQSTIPWRAIRASVVSSEYQVPMTEVREPPKKDKGVLVVDLLTTHGPLRSSTLARLLDSHVSEVGTLCQGLYADGKIALAEVYGNPANKRASHRVWAVDINEFDVDPFEE